MPQLSHVTFSIFKFFHATLMYYFGRKRTVSEVQLMHNLREHKQVQERLERLQRRLRGIHRLGLNNGSDKPGRGRKGAFQEQPNLRDLTPEDIQAAINALEKHLLH